MTSLPTKAEIIHGGSEWTPGGAELSDPCVRRRAASGVEKEAGGWLRPGSRSRGGARGERGAARGPTNRAQRNRGGTAAAARLRFFLALEKKKQRAEKLAGKDPLIVACSAGARSVCPCAAPSRPHAARLEPDED